VRYREKAPKFCVFLPHANFSGFFCEIGMGKVLLTPNPRGHVVCQNFASMSYRTVELLWQEIKRSEDKTEAHSMDAMRPADDLMNEDMFSV